ncbi:MAG: DUF4105 domain-containing protein [Myxococcales bacterium]|nr:DUF4105 domain-containing protein [Myxococcales bacterium]
MGWSAWGETVHWIALLLTDASRAQPLEVCSLSVQESATYLLTAQPKQDAVSLFGHTALLFWDPDDKPRAVVYDFGRFDPASMVSIAWRFLNGSQRYYLAEDAGALILDDLTHTERGVIAQRLALTQRERTDLRDRLRHQVAHRPDFAYHWYDANCTTKVRDLLDDVFQGSLAPQHTDPSGTSPAREVLRHARGHPLWLGLHWGSGRHAHAEVGHWESMFLPQTLMRRIGVSQRPDGTGPLVEDTCQLVDDGQPPIAEDAPDRSAWLWAGGLAAAGVLLGLAQLARPRALRAVGITGLVVGLYGTAALLVGLLGTFAPFWGHHNLWFAHPGWLLLVPAARLHAHAGLWPQRAALGLLAIIALGLLAALASGGQDHSLGTVGALLPAALASAWILRPSSAVEHGSEVV